MKKKKTKWKVPNLVFFIFLIGILILYGQYVYLSLSKSIYGINMNKFAANRNTVTKEKIAERGKIFDVNGDTLALNVTSYTLIAYLDEKRVGTDGTPKYVVDKEDTAKKLASVLEADGAYILERLNKKQYQVQFGNYGRNITELKKKEIESLGLSGIDFEKTVNRYYPSGNFASYTIGYAKTGDDGIIKGMLGVESNFNDKLTGINGYDRYEQDKFGYKIPNTPEENVDAIDGDDIYLTIDSSIQRFVESAIYKVDSEYEPEWTIIEVMDAKSGAILGSSSTTSFDPNNIPSDMSYENPLVSYTYEPGSTMKIFTYMCAMEKGVYNGSETYPSGSFKVDEENKINDWNKSGWGDITYDTGFEYSSNTAIANIISKYLSRDELKECFTKYGFGDATGIELSGEAKGKLNFKYPIEVLAAGYGQGILTTPIQHLQALSIIANDGIMITPHIVTKIDSKKNNKETTTKIKKSDRIVSHDTIVKIKDLMEKVVSDDWATGHKYYIENFGIIGKTGTAQIYENGKYLTGTTDYISSISMMYPKDNPKIIIYAATKKPSHNQNYALSESIQELTKNIAKYYNMFNEGENTLNNTNKMENYLGKNTSDVVSALNSKGVSPIVIGNGDIIINQYPKKGVTLVNNYKVFLVTNGDNITMPNITGWSRNDVERYCNLVNIECKFNGTGYAVSQSIPDGSAISGVLEVTLENRG